MRWGAGGNRELLAADSGAPGEGGTVESSTRLPTAAARQPEHHHQPIVYVRLTPPAAVPTLHTQAHANANRVFVVFGCYVLVTSAALSAGKRLLKGLLAHTPLLGRLLRRPVGWALDNMFPVQFFGPYLAAYIAVRLVVDAAMERVGGAAVLGRGGASGMGAALCFKAGEEGWRIDGGRSHGAGGWGKGRAVLEGTDGTGGKQWTRLCMAVGL